MRAVTDQTRLDDWLAARTPDQLVGVLQNRQDVLWGAPLGGVDDLALRLSQPVSIGINSANLPLPGIQLLHAWAALGPSPTLSKAGSLLLSGDRSPELQRMAVRSALSMLADRALAWL